MKQAFLVATFIVGIVFYSSGIFFAGMAVGGGLAIVHSMSQTLGGTG
jgi:alcohol dehydrogenase class IV